MTDRPNIIFIFSDQHRLSGVGAYAVEEFPSFRLTSY